MSSSAHGHFIWHDLITTDIPAAVEFYKKVIGWTTQPFDPDGKYLMWANKGGPVGGVGPAEAGNSAHWRPYIGTDDIGATIALAEKLGGSVVTPATDISNGGKWAALKDPQGNQFGLYWSANNPAPELKMQPGEFHWHELATNDHKRAFQFYQQLFGWEPAREHDMGDIGIYALFKNEGRSQGLGGMFNKPASMPHGGWCTYTIVKDVGKAAKLIAKLGGKTTHEPVQVPGGSWTLKFNDAQGVPHALTSSDYSTAVDANQTKAKKKRATTKPEPIKSKSNLTATKTTAAPAKKSAKKKSVKKPAPKKVVQQKAKVDKKQLKKVEKKKKKALKKLKKQEKKLKKKDKKERKKKTARKK